MFLRAAALAVSLTTAVAQQLVAELDPAPATIVTTNAQHALAGPGHVWFTADASGVGRELFRTDGTIVGTSLWLDHRSGAANSSARALAVLGNRVVFHAVNPLANEFAVFASDGTAAGTVRLHGSIDSITNVRVLGSANGRLVLVDNRANWRVITTDVNAGGSTMIGSFLEVGAAVEHNGEVLLLGRWSDFGLWATDGTTLFGRLPLGGRAVSGFAALGGQQYFLVDDPTNQTWLWRTDGSAAGTTQVVALGPTQGQSSIATLGAQLVIGASNALFVGDGTAGGTTSLGSGSVTRSITSLGSFALFTRRVPVGIEQELWRTDGTPAGTQLVFGTPHGYEGMVAAQGCAFAFATDATGFHHLLRTDGTAAGTRLLPMNSRPDQSSIAPLGANAVVTGALRPPFANTIETYVTDGSVAGTNQLLQNQSRPGVRSAGRSTAVGEALLFVAETAATGSELWRTDGTAAGTQLVQDFAPGPANGISDVVTFRGEAWFLAGNRLWRSDGTAAGSSIALQPDPTASYLFGLVATDDWLVFASTSTLSQRLWRSDGTVGGTQELDSVGLWQFFQDWRQIGNRTFYVKFTGSSRRLWCTDGSASGPTDLSPVHSVVGALGSRLVFVRQVGNGYELAATTGTIAGTTSLGTVPAPPQASAATEDRLVWIDWSGAVFATDGVLPPVALPVPIVRQPPVRGEDAVYLVTEDPTAGRRLFRTDGTVAGTSLAATIGANATGALTVAKIGAGNRLFLAGSDGTSGNEPWLSDGSQAGTYRLADLHPNGNSEPAWLGTAGQVGYFLADDGQRGRELWKVDLGAVGAANVQSFGVGCAGAAGEPRQFAANLPRPGTNLTLGIDRAPPSSFALWLVGTGLGNLPVGGGCTVLVQDLYFILWSITDAAGRATVQLGLPANPALIGMMATSQGSMLDPLGASAFGTSVTPGLLLVIGA
jgi:ELWxxDGT repeat protein